MAFFGREKEKKKLSDTIKSNGMQVMLVYGRRRVGKSQLPRPIKGRGLPSFLPNMVQEFVSRPSGPNVQ